MDIIVKGFDETEEDLDRMQRELTGSPMLNAMRDAAMLVTRDAKRLAPVDTGRLRASITPDVRKVSSGFEGVVGSNVVYAPYVETGTRPHWPPQGALATWARRHGWKEADIRFVIGTRGTRAQPYLVPAFVDNADKIIRILERGVSKVIED
jgi:HK97 gp10 family phage protein